MREVSQTPSLFDAPLPAAAAPASTLEEKGPEKIAKDFVRWCCSIGADFRNSPDITNLRYWARKSKVKVKDRDETGIVEMARALFLKRIGQLVNSGTDV